MYGLGQIGPTIMELARLVLDLAGFWLGLDDLRDNGWLGIMYFFSDEMLLTPDAVESAKFSFLLKMQYLCRVSMAIFSWPGGEDLCIWLYALK